MATKATFISFGPFFVSGVLQTSIELKHWKAGTTTTKTVWSDRDKSSAEGATLTGDSNGMVSCFADGLYKFEVRDSGSNTLYTYDNLQVGAVVEDPRPIVGLGFGVDTGDSDHDIEINIGAAQDDTDTENMELTSIIVKRIDASWTVGTNLGGMDTGAVTNNTWYYLWLIERSDTDVVDVLFSTDATNPTMPSNYNRKRRIGSVLSDGSANIRQLFNEAGTPINTLALKNGAELTIDGSGVITVTHGYHQVDTASDDSTDDLDTINGGRFAGQLLVLSAINATRDVVVKDGAGNIITEGDFTMDHTDDRITLMFDGTNWFELARTNSA